VGILREKVRSPGTSVLVAEGTATKSEKESLPHVKSVNMPKKRRGRPVKERSNIKPGELCAKGKKKTIIK